MKKLHEIPSYAAEIKTLAALEMQLSTAQAKRLELIGRMAVMSDNTGASALEKAKALLLGTPLPAATPDALHRELAELENTTSILRPAIAEQKAKMMVLRGELVNIATKEAAPSHVAAVEKIVLALAALESAMQEEEAIREKLVTADLDGRLPSFKDYTLAERVPRIRLEGSQYIDDFHTEVAGGMDKPARVRMLVDVRNVGRCGEIVTVTERQARQLERDRSAERDQGRPSVVEIVTERVSKAIGRATRKADTEPDMGEMVGA